MGEFNVNKSTGDLIPTAGMVEEYPANQVTYNNTVSGLTATDVQGAVDELKNGLISYFDSEMITFTNVASNKSANQLVTNYNVPSGYTVISRELFVISVAQSWNVQITYLRNIDSVSVHNYGTTDNTIKLRIRSLCVKS